MARPIDPDAPYRVKIHEINGYKYASTQPVSIDPKNGKRKYHRIHWGRVDENLKFTPGTKFFLATPKERESLNFPKNWDMSETKKFTGLKETGRPEYKGESHNRLYGDVWLLEQVALKTGIRQDLERVFEGNRELVDDIITLAMFPYITKYTYNRLARWQAIEKTPSKRSLSAKDITLLTQSITEQNRMDLLSLRAKRLGKDELCAVDSTSRSAYGDSLSDIHWGKNKDRLSLPQTTEVVVYTLSSHMPIYYRTFPGNMPDSRSLKVIFKDLDHAGFKDLVFITDRGYDTLGNLEYYILHGKQMVMFVKSGQREAMRAIAELGEFGGIPPGMQVDADAKVYHRQYDINYTVKGTGTSSKKSNHLKLNLYFDPIRRALELMELDIALSFQEETLINLMDNGTAIYGDEYKREFNYYKVTLDDDTKTVIDFEMNEKKVAKKRSQSGFFSIMTHGVNFIAMETYHAYQLRDEQEKYFQQMKGQMGSDRQRNWSEEGKTGRLFILFVSLIISSYVRHIWKSTKLSKLFTSSLDILDEMRSIRMIEHTNRAKVITPFIGKQIDIAEAFGFEIPKGCEPSYYMSRPKNKRGRKQKKVV
jgi:hypothetical protein